MRTLTLISPFNILLEILARAIRQGKRKRRHPNWKGGSKMVSVFRLPDLRYRKPCSKNF